MLKRGTRRHEGQIWLLTQVFRWAGILALAAAGCEAPVPNALVDGNGSQIRLSAITAILGDADLNEEQKRQALRDLGISDESLIDALIAGGL